MSSAERAAFSPPVTLWLVIFSVAYFLAFLVGMNFYFEPENVSTVWPASGVALGALLVVPYRQWPAVFCIQAAIHFGLCQWHLGYSVVFSVLATLANVLGNLVSAALIRRTCGSVFSLGELKHIVVLVLAALLGEIIGALAGAAAVTSVFDVESFWSVWQVWCFADMVGILLVTPAIVGLAGFRSAAARRMTPNAVTEAVAMLASTVIVGHAVFSAEPGKATTILDFPYLIVPILLWGALRIRPNLAALALLTTGILVVYHADHGLGPFVVNDQSTQELVLSVQLFLVIACLLFLVVSAVLAERSSALSGFRESEQRFQEMAAHIGEVFWLFDWTDQRFIYASPAYETVWGRTVEDLYANYGEWGESIHPGDRAYAEESFARVLESEGNERREYRIVRPNGEVRWVADRAFPVRDESGQIVRIAGIAEDITARKRNEEDRRRLEAKMQHAQKLESLGVLAGGIAHDFNNLLTAILGNADLALLSLTPEAPGRGNLEKVETAARRAAELTNQMLAYSGKGQFVVQPIRLDRVVEEMSHLLETVISKKASLQLESASRLPAIEADPSQMRQVVMNLITNASEALENQPGRIRISTEGFDADRAYLSEYAFGDARPEGRYVSLEVSDTGCGMDLESQRKIFDPFFTTKFTGRGLGLAAVQGIVNGHHGAIKVYSEPQRGSTIKILFPASEAILEPVAEKAEKPQTETGDAVVLVVDDEPQVLDVAVQMLEHAGFTVRTAADGREGVEMFKEHADEIALVVLDMTMPHMDGEEAFREIRRIRSNAPVILSSGYNQQDATNRFVGKGLAGFIQKPYRSVSLLEKVYEALEQA